MGQKKRTKNKQNYQPIKKTTINHFNYTQQIQIPTLSNVQTKTNNKSIQLKKLNATKKSLSRKSKCVSVKQTSIALKPTCTSAKQSINQPLKYKQIMKKFQELKGLQEKSEKSRSKSAKSIREGYRLKSPNSGLKQKINSKKFNLSGFVNKTLNRMNQNKSQFNSRMSLTNKLQKTLKKLNQNDYFQNDEQDSLLPFVSTSQAQEYAKNKSIQISGNQFIQDDQINIYEMRKFSKTLEIEEFYQVGIKKNINYFRGDQYEMMAVKIQRAWRRYRTKKLVDRYAQIFYPNYQQQLKYIENSQNRLSNSIESLQKYNESKSFEVDDIEQEENLTNQSGFDKYNKQKKSLYLEEEELSGERFFNKKSSGKEEEKYFNQYKGIEYESEEEQKGQGSEQKNSMEESNNQNSNSAQGLFQSQKLYPQNLLKQQHLITYISNLQEQDISEHVCTQQSQDTQKNHLNSIKPKEKQLQFYQYSQKSQQQPTKPSQIQKYEQFISRIKKDELQKWKQIISLLEESKQKNNPKQIQNILEKLEKKTEKNKKEMELIQKQSIIASSLGSNSQKKSVNSYENQLIQKIDHKERKSRNRIKKEKTNGSQQSQQIFKRKKQESGPSESSDFKKEQEFDSRKYIEYLDSDMFLLDRERSSENSELINDQRLGKRISKRKQKQLLAGLNIQGPPIKLRSHHVSKSQNLSYLMMESNSFVPAMSHRLNKSTSQKNILKVIKSLSPQLQYPIQQNYQTDQLNLDLIRQQFLQNADPVQQLQKLHSNHELKMKIKQSLQSQYISLINNDNDDQNQDQYIPCRINLDLDKTFNIEADKNNKEPEPFYKKEKNTHSNSNSHGQGSVNEQQKNQYHKIIVVEDIDKNLEDEIQNNDEQEKQKKENLSFMVYNTLILQILRQIASYDTILEKFKEYTLSVKSQQQQKEGKKGFQTNHTEVKNYVEGLISFLLNQEPQVFKNLQIPAGPSALEMLHYMHPNQYDQSVDEESNNSQDETSVMVIPNRMFDKYWEVKEKSLKFDSQSDSNNQQRKKRNLDYLKSLTKVFYRSIFDTFNECLDLQRNFGQAGKPYPWKKPSRFQHTKSFPEIQKSILNSQKRMNQIATTYCGLIIQKNEMAKITMQGSDDYIQHVQQDRMSRMLAQDLIEGEQRWTFYDDQQLELLVEIGNYITITLILQAAEDVKIIMGV